MAITIVKRSKENWIQAASGLKAIAHPVRLAMIDLLKEGAKNVTEIHMTLGVEQAVASQHLSILREKGVCVSRKRGKHAYYYLQNHELVEAVEALVQGVEARKN